MRFVGMNLAIKINNTTVIATGYTMLNTGIDIEITAFKPWLAIIKLIKMKTNTNALYDTFRYDSMEIFRNCNNKPACCS